MEVVFLVIASFIGGRFESLEIRNYSEFTQNESSCEEYIKSMDFKKTLRLKPKTQRIYRVACTTASQLAGFDSIAAQAATWKELTLSQPVKLEGRILSDVDTGRRKSVQAYQGLDLTISTAQGRFALYASGTVSEKQLRALNGKTVKLRAVFEDHTPADNAIEQYPTDALGKPLKRTGYRVIAIE